VAVQVPFFNTSIYPPWANIKNMPLPLPKKIEMLNCGETIILYTTLLKKSMVATLY